MAFVADNSVIIAWLTESQANAYTRRLFTRAHRETVHVPALWPFEFVNTLCVMTSSWQNAADCRSLLVIKQCASRRSASASHSSDRNSRRQTAASMMSA